MLSLKIGLPQYKNSPPKVQKPAYFQKVVDTHSFVGIITQQLDCALINGQFFHLSNNIIIFSHQLLQTTSVLLGFFILNRKGR